MSAAVTEMSDRDTQPPSARADPVGVDVAGLGTAEPLPPARTSARLSPPMPDDRLFAWLLAVLLGLVAFGLRVFRINYPGQPIFDEAYYPPQSWEMLHNGYEYNRGYYFIVHPPFGKWNIAVGEWLFGYEPVGWRFSGAVVGAVAVVIMVMVTRRMTRSTLLGMVAGILLAADGLSFTLARIGLLDIFLQMWVLAGFACLVADRDFFRNRLAVAVTEGTVGRYGPRTTMRWWRLAGGIILGLACAVKWSGVWFLAIFAILSVVWDRGALRSAGVRGPTRATAIRSLPGALWALGVVPILSYLATWTGWFVNESSQGRHWAEQNPDTSYGFIPPVLRSLWHMHAEWLDFHNGLSKPHPWESGPWSWLVDGRPIALWNATETVNGDPIHRTVLMLGTPTLWWAFVPAAGWMLWRVIARRDWRAVAVLAGVAAGWASWLINLERTMFIFYMAPVVPFFVLGLTIMLGDVLGRPWAAPRRRMWGLIGLSVGVGLVVATYIFFFPALTGLPLGEFGWEARIWFPSWL